MLFTVCVWLLIWAVCEGDEGRGEDISGGCGCGGLDAAYVEYPVVFSPLSGAAGVVGTCLHIVCEWYINNGQRFFHTSPYCSRLCLMSSCVEVRHFGDVL